MVLVLPSGEPWKVQPVARTLGTIEAHRGLSRSGLWLPRSKDLQLPVESRGLSVKVTASNGLRLTPDYDTLAWLCHRWINPPKDLKEDSEGWFGFSLYGLGSDLYSKAPTGKDYATLRESLRRLGSVSLELQGYDASTATKDHRKLSYGQRLLEGVTQADGVKLNGLEVQRVRLAPWLREELEAEGVVLLPWQILRRFHKNQHLAKRLWIYLQAERFRQSPSRPGFESSWIALGDYFNASLGLDYNRPRDARAALTRACRTVEAVDHRYGFQSTSERPNLEVRQWGKGWRLYAYRPTSQTWKVARKTVKADLRHHLGSA